MLSSSRFYHVSLPQTYRGFEMHCHLKKTSRAVSGMAEEKIFSAKQKVKRKGNNAVTGKVLFHYH